MHRRALIATATVGAMGAIAGCLGDDNGGSTPTATPDDEVHDDVAIEELILPREALAGDGWTQDGQPVDGPVEYHHEGFNLTVWTTAMVYQSVDDAVSQFETKRDQADVVDELDIGDRCVTADPPGNIAEGLLQQDNLLGEILIYHLDADQEAQTEQIDVASLLDAMHDGWPS